MVPQQSRSLSLLSLSLSLFFLSTEAKQYTTVAFPNSVCESGSIGVGHIPLSTGETEIHCGCPSDNLRGFEACPTSLSSESICNSVVDIETGRHSASCASVACIGSSCPKTTVSTTTTEESFCYEKKGILGITSVGGVSKCSCSSKSAGFKVCHSTAHGQATCIATDLDHAAASTSEHEQSISCGVVCDKGYYLTPGGACTEHIKKRQLITPVGPSGAFTQTGGPSASYTPGGPSPTYSASVPLPTPVGPFTPGGATFVASTSLYTPSYGASQGFGGSATYVASPPAYTVPPNALPTVGAPSGVFSTGGATLAVSTPGSAVSSYYIPPNAGGGASLTYTPPAPYGSGYGASPTFSYQTQVVTYATQPPSQRTVYHQTPATFQSTGGFTEVVATPTPAVGSVYTVPANASPSAAYTPSGATGPSASYSPPGNGGQTFIGGTTSAAPTPSIYTPTYGASQYAGTGGPSVAFTPGGNTLIGATTGLPVAGDSTFTVVAPTGASQIPVAPGASQRHRARAPKGDTRAEVVLVRGA